MKKIARTSKKIGKLNLSKETVRDLTRGELRDVGGGATAPYCYLVTGACTNYGCGQTNTARCG